MPEPGPALRSFASGWGAIALVAAMSGCSQFQQAKPATPAAMAIELRDHPVSPMALHAAAADGPRRQVLQLRETGLAGVKLADTAAVLTAHLGSPTTAQTDREGAWWDYDRETPSLHLRIRLAGIPLVVVQIQAWPPALAETSTFMRPLDPASRLQPKYGPPYRKLPWGQRGGEAWLYPAANVAYVLTPADATDRRLVAGIIVGL